jgi:hypothetical protein
MTVQSHEATGTREQNITEEVSSPTEILKAEIHEELF